MSQPLTDTALDAQSELLAWHLSDPGRRYCGAEFSQIFGKQLGLGIPEQFTEAGVPVTQKQIAMREGSRAFQQTLRYGATFAVTSDIVDVLEVAAAKLTPYELHASDLPSPFGFVWLERPVVFLDDTPERKPMVTRALGWFSAMDLDGAHGVLLMMWTEPLDPRDHVHQSFTDDLAVLRGHGMVPPRGLWSMAQGVWVFGENPERRGGCSGSLMFMLAFLRFIAEPWIDKSPVQPSRPTARRAVRAKLHDPKVRVVRLRKRQGGSTGDGTPRGPLKVRTLVGAAKGGHWRNVWYPTLGIHRERWIWPYERGPKDAPLRIPDTVTRVDR